MKRRGFLKRLAGVFTAAVVSEKVVPDDGVALYSAKHPGMGLAPLKPEGDYVLYDDLGAPVDLTEASLEQACIDLANETDGRGIGIRPNFIHVLRDDLRDAFNDAFDDHYTDDDGA